MSSDPFAAEPPWRAGVRGARANLWPGLVLQAAALALVIAYYRHPPTHDIVNRIAVLHERAGFWFGIASTGLFGGLIPVIYLRGREKTRDVFTRAAAAVVIGFWAYKGFEIDLWYHLQAHLVGATNDARTVFVKMILDQFVYCPVLAVPVTVLVYEWAQAGFRTRLVFADVRAGGWYRRRVLPVLMSNFGVWVPAVCIIYALPTPLQLPLQNLVLCFFTLLLAHVIRR